MSTTKHGNQLIDAYVAAIAIASALAMYLAWQVRSPFPGAMAMVSTCAVAVLLYRS